MIASGIIWLFTSAPTVLFAPQHPTLTPSPLASRFCNAKIFFTYNSKYFVSLACSTGNSTLIPEYPNRSPNPPATSTNAVDLASSTPTRSSSTCSCPPYFTTLPAGTLGVHPSNGFFPSRDAANNPRALAIYFATPPGYPASATLNCSANARLASSSTPGAGHARTKWLWSSAINARINAPCADVSTLAATCASTIATDAAFSDVVAIAVRRTRFRASSNGVPLVARVR
mmetsp:Transcript_1627/g.5889  ORF Transcript_1627/g.5889 Transcript_1627/m.5889 type:complete len:229 (+) Transcript_1627:2809-3495(+)